MPGQIKAAMPDVHTRRMPHHNGGNILDFEIFADSSANLTEEMIAEGNIKVISYVCMCDGREVVCYKNGRAFSDDAREFYDAMGRGAAVSTSLITCERLEEEFERVLKSGRDVLMITISSQVSGTHHQAELAARSLKEKYPERRIYIVDSANSGFGEGMLAVNAARLRAMGEDIETCRKWLENNKFRLNSYFTVADLKYLKRGGRISGAVAIAGTILNIKPILKADGNGRISMCGKVRGRKKSVAELADCYRAYAVFPEAKTVAISHCGCREEADALADMVREMGAEDITIEYFDIVSGAHVGPGSLGIFFTGKDRRKEHAAADKKPAGKTVRANG